MRKRVSLKRAICPKCGVLGGLKRILWGMPLVRDRDKNVIFGGCCIPEVPTEVGCSNCGWEGFREELGGLN